MQKVFALLMAEFRKLGATIIFASFSKVIIDTGKSDLLAAKAYCDSLLKTLQTRLVLDSIIFFHIPDFIMDICFFLCLHPFDLLFSETFLSGLNLSLRSSGIPSFSWIR